MFAQFSQMKIFGWTLLRKFLSIKEERQCYNGSTKVNVSATYKRDRSHVNYLLSINWRQNSSGRKKPQIEKKQDGKKPHREKGLVNKNSKLFKIKQELWDYLLNLHRKFLFYLTVLSWKAANNNCFIKNGKRQ